MKLCIDCMYFVHNSSKCGRTSEPDPVRGLPQSPYALIERAATHEGACGPTAKFFKIIPVAVAA